MNRSQDVRKYILNHIYKQNGCLPTDIEDSMNLIDKGLLDSFGTLTLIVSLENNFKVSLDPLELADASAQTLGGLQSLVVKKIQE